MRQLRLDGHVHMYPQFSFQKLLESAKFNLQLTPGIQGMLCFTERSKENYFPTLSSLPLALPAQWKMYEGISSVYFPDGIVLSFLSGFQIVTKEKIEVLQIGALTRVHDGRSFDETVAEAAEKSVAVVVPWSPGKWLGERGKIIATKPPHVFFGDILLGALRISSLPSPCLNGTDPLPLSGDEALVGTLGSELSISEEVTTLAQLKSALNTGLAPFGQKQGVFAAASRYARFCLRKEKFI